MIAKGSCVFMRRGLLIAGILAATCSALWAQNNSQSDPPPAAKCAIAGETPNGNCSA
jgi:hypothetical protein